MSKATVKINTMSLPTLLTVLFVGLKLTHYIDWSWWLVLLPTIIPFAIALGLLGLALVAAVIGVLSK